MNNPTTVIESYDMPITQFVRMEKKAQVLGMSVSEYLVFMLSSRVGTTQDLAEAS